MRRGEGPSVRIRKRCRGRSSRTDLKTEKRIGSKRKKTVPVNPELLSSGSRDEESPPSGDDVCLTRHVGEHAVKGVRGAFGLQHSRLGDDISDVFFSDLKVLLLGEP